MTMKTAEQWANDPRCGLGNGCGSCGPCNPPDFPEIGACDWCVLVDVFREALAEKITLYEAYDLGKAEGRREGLEDAALIFETAKRKCLGESIELGLGHTHCEACSYNGPASEEIRALMERRS